MIGGFAVMGVCSVGITVAFSLQVHTYIHTCACSSYQKTKDDQQLLFATEPEWKYISKERLFTFKTFVRQNLLFLLDNFLNLCLFALVSYVKFSSFH